MNESVFLWIEPLVTVFSGQSQVTVQLAAKEVLQTIPGLDTGLVDSYIAARLESAINNLPAPPFPSSSGQNNAAGQNNVLTLVSEAQLNDESSAMISTVISQSFENQETPFQVLKWQYVTENNTSLFTDAMSELLVNQYNEPELYN